MRPQGTRHTDTLFPYTTLCRCCLVRKGLRREERTNMGGKQYQITDAVSEPKPVQSPLPLLIGGKGDRMLGVVARHADEWNMWGLASTIEERSAVLAQHCEAIDRDPGDIKRSAQALVKLTEIGRASCRERVCQ